MTNLMQTEHLSEQLMADFLSELSPTQEIALKLYELGLNVFPAPHGKKGGWAWRNLQFTRLHPKDLVPLFSGQCNVAVMMGRTSNNLFVIDCETEASFKFFEAELIAHHIPIWAVKTGGNKGGGHFYIQCEDGEIKGFQADDFEIRGSRCYVLAPPSCHPDGGQYSFYQRDQPAPPLVKIGDLAWLKLKLVKHSRPSTNSLMRKLCTETRNYISVGAKEGERNNRLFKAACDIAGNGIGDDIARDWLCPISIRIGLPESEIEATIGSAYSQPRTPSRPANQPATMRQWEIAWAWAQKRQWAGRSGQTDRAVFLACCKRAETSNHNGTFRASSREVADISGVSRKTVSKSLKRLVSADILVYAGTDRQSGANLYRLGNDTTKNSRDYSANFLPVRGLDSGELSTKNTLSITHDIAERKALGKTAYHLYTVMITLDEPLRAKQLAEYSKLSVGQVYRALKKLRDYDLAEKVTGGFQAICCSDEELIEQVAIPAGTYGKTAQRKHQHQQERAKLAGRELYKSRFERHFKQYKSAVMI